MPHFFSFARFRRALGWLPALLLAALLLAAPAFAQVDTYRFTPSTGTFVPLPATATNVPDILGDDRVSAVLPLGLSFVYDGTPFSSFRVSSNGFVSFNAASGNNLTNDLGTADASTEKPLVAPFWDDLDGAEPTARASYQTTGTAPGRVFTFEWLNWKRYGNGVGPSFSMQVRLYEGSGRIEFVYRRETATVTNATVSIGLAGPVTGTTPSNFLSLSDASANPTASGTVDTNSIGSPPATGQVYTFLPPLPSACPTPRGLRAAPTSTTAATLSWTVAAVGGTFTVQYGPTGFNPALPSSATNVYTTVTGIAGTSTAVAGLNGNTPYQFYVTQVCGAAGSSGRSNAASFILNDEPCGAGVLVINPTCVPTNGTTQGATTTTANGYANPSVACNNFNATPRDVWYRFTTAATGLTSTSVRISVTGAAEAVRAFSGASCNGPLTELGCASQASGTPGTPNLDLAQLTASTTYYLAVSNGSAFAPVLGAFTICAVPVPNCAEPVALTASALTGNSATLTWGSQMTTGQTFVVVYGSMGTFDPNVAGTRLTGLTATTVPLTSLLPNTTYTAYVQRVCGGFDGSSIFAGPLTFTTPPVSPANDEPCGARALASGATVTGNTLGATNSTQVGLNVGNCSPARQPNDVWYSFTAGSGGGVSLAFLGSNAGAVRLFSAPACTGPFTAEQCFSTGGAATGLGTVQFVGLTPGTTYYAAVSGYAQSSPAGTFSVTATVLLGSRARANTDALLVYPNPSNTGQLTLRLAPAGGSREATLFNALGQAVLRQPLAGAGAEHALDTRRLATGIYTLRVSQGDETFTRRVVLE